MMELEALPAAAAPWQAKLQHPYEAALCSLERSSVGGSWLDCMHSLRNKHCSGASQTLNTKP